MKELEELRTFISKKEVQAWVNLQKCLEMNDEFRKTAIIGYQIACTDIIEKLDLILNSCVKPSDERSPTDEIQQTAVSRPSDESKSKKD